MRWGFSPVWGKFCWGWWGNNFCIAVEESFIRLGDNDKSGQLLEEVTLSEVEPSQWGEIRHCKSLIWRRYSFDSVSLLWRSEEDERTFDWLGAKGTGEMDFWLGKGAYRVYSFTLKVGPSHQGLPWSMWPLLLHLGLTGPALQHGHMA